jgi:hypothetical protein
VSASGTRDGRKRTNGKGLPGNGNQRLDRVTTTAPFGGAAAGAHPTDRGKKGTTHIQLHDG